MIDNDKAKSTYTNPKPALSKHESGFTLIEVMVALAILAVVAVAASRASSAYLSS
ncbi:MAG: prepilin-type N-terminal cleavage/methylation domain-containing protein, partial [Psychrobacter sp.]|nr:prepilin-type N-terminal cleavage/methylation domain-containing protein [Psychrobacter sp.]